MLVQQWCWCRTSLSLAHRLHAHPPPFVASPSPLRVLRLSRGGGSLTGRQDSRSMLATMRIHRPTTTDRCWHRLTFIHQPCLVEVGIYDQTRMHQWSTEDCCGSSNRRPRWSTAVVENLVATQGRFLDFKPPTKEHFFCFSTPRRLAEAPT